LDLPKLVFSSKVYWHSFHQNWKEKKVDLSSEDSDVSLGYKSEWLTYLSESIILLAVTMKKMEEAKNTAKWILCYIIR